MSALQPADARKLTASLALLASNHDGEVIAAVGAVGRILGKAGLGFADLRVVPALPPPSPLSPAPTRPNPRAYETRVLCEHQRQARLLLASLFSWDEWERDFLASLAALNGALTGKQRSRLDQLGAKFQAWRTELEMVA